MIRRLLSLLTSSLLLLTAASHAAPPLDASPFDGLYADLRRVAPALDPEVLELALRSAQCAQSTGLAPDARHLTVIDYSLPSTERRLWVLDLEERSLLFEELVSHGVNTGENRATEFSNILGSRQSSLGMFRTAGTYTGRNGHSLKLHGLEEGINHLALERTIVMHGAWYVSEEFAKQHGRLGRSWGCPALDKAIAREVIETIKGGDLVFSYYPDEKWLTSSELLKCSASRASNGEFGATSAAGR